MSWLNFLLPASFNGVPFYIDQTAREGGRRVVVHEFPQRDDPYIEDLGRLPRSFTVNAYVVGDFYMAQRLLLETALESSSTVGTLIHPTYGIQSVWIGKIKSAEHREVGGYATVEFECTVDGGVASPLSITDTVSALLSGLASLTPYLEAAYIATVGVGILSNVIAAVVGPQLSNAGAQFAALPQATQAGITPGFNANVASASVTASAVTTAFAAAAANVIAAQPVAAGVVNPVTGTVGALVAPADASGGLVGMVSFGATATPQPMAASPAAIAAQAAVISLVQGAALQAALTVFAQTDFQSVNQAAAAQSAVQPLLDNQVATAANSGNYDLFRAWRAISAQVNADFTNRAKNLPSLATYTTPFSVPALVLAQRLYQDGTQADGLVALNAVAHPIFMPPTGNWLQAA